MQSFSPDEIPLRMLVVGPRLPNGGPGGRERGARLGELCLERRSIEAREDLPRFDVVIEVDLEARDASRDLRADEHGRERLDVAGGVDLADEIAPRDHLETEPGRERYWTRPKRRPGGYEQKQNQGQRRPPESSVPPPALALTLDELRQRLAPRLCHLRAVDPGHGGRLIL